MVGRKTKLGPKVKKDRIIDGIDFVPFFAGVVYASTEFAKELGPKTLV